MDILLAMEERGYPIEYLLSRIRGRRSRLVRDWRPLIYEASPLEYLSSARYQGFVRDRSPEGMWRDLLKEYRWVYAQMNEALRRAFQPFFLYAELRTLVICLRYIQGGKAEKMEDLLGASLLPEALKSRLRTSEDISSGIAAVEDFFAVLAEGFRGLGLLYEKEGLRLVEQQLTNRYLVYTMNAGPNPVIRGFFSRLIDARNIMNLYKSLRLDLKDASVFIPGGGIPLERLHELMEKDDLFEVSTLIRQAAGVPVATPGPTQVEAALYKGVTKFVKKEGRDPLGVGLILDYLWRCSLEVMNLSVLFHGKALEREAVSAELVR